MLTMKSLIYASNQSSQTVTSGSQINLGSVNRRIGCTINLNGTNLTFAQSGYYDIDIDTTFVGTVGDVTINVLQNGIPITGATATETIGTASTEIHNAHISTTIRVYCCVGTVISLGVASSSTSTPTFSDVSVRVKKI